MKARYLSLALSGLTLLAAGPAFAGADLVPIVSQVPDGTVAVRNIGDAPAGPSHLTLTCTAYGPPQCPEGPGMAAYENPAFPNSATVEVPALEPGETYSHDLAFFPGLEFDPGTYEFSLYVDQGDAVEEDQEFNNSDEIDKVVLPPVGVGPDSSKPGSLTTKPAKPRVVVPLKAAAKGASDKLAAGLPNLLATTLGMNLPSGFAPWGTTKVIDQAHLASKTKVGPLRNLCQFPQLAYRTFNASPFAAGAFVNFVYRDNKSITKHHLSLGAHEGNAWQTFPMALPEGKSVIRVEIDAKDKVAESDEANSFQVIADVRIDCDGDGKIAGKPGGFKAKRKAAPVKARVLELAPAQPAKTKTLRLKRRAK